PVPAGPDTTCKAAAAGFRGEGGREVVSVLTGVDVDDVDRADAVEGIHGQRRGGVDHTRIEAPTENRGDLVLFAELTALPLVVGVPRRGFADLARVFVDGSIEVGRAGLDTGLQ